jgi:hypothetical protein
MSTNQDYKGIGILFTIGNFNRLSSTEITNYIQNGITFPLVFYSHKTYIVPDTMPNSVYFTYKYGIIRYDYKDGRIYGLIRR